MADVQSERIGIQQLKRKWMEMDRFRFIDDGDRVIAPPEMKCGGQMAAESPRWPSIRRIYIQSETIWTVPLVFNNLLESIRADPKGFFFQFIPLSNPVSHINLWICDLKKKTALKIVRKRVVSLEAQTQTNETKLTVP